MSSDEYEHQSFYLLPMKKMRIRISLHMYPGLKIGIGFPWTAYVDMNVNLIFFVINFKWRKR